MMMGLNKETNFWRDFNKITYSLLCIRYDSTIRTSKCYKPVKAKENQLNQFVIQWQSCELNMRMSRVNWTWRWVEWMAQNWLSLWLWLVHFLVFQHLNPQRRFKDEDIRVSVWFTKGFHVSFGCWIKSILKTDILKTFL